jgi:hypothetical protein
MQHAESSSLTAFILNSNSFTVGTEVLIVVVMKNSVFWDITSCSPLKVS